MAADESQEQERSEDLCHLKNPELEPKYQKYKSRVVLRGDSVTDDPGSYAQMTAAKGMDMKSRLPGCSRQAADAVSFYTQVKMEDASTLFKRMSRYLDTSTKAHMTKIMVQIGRPSRSSRRESVRSSFGRTIMRKAICENPIAARLGQSFQLECVFVNREKGLFLSVCGRQMVCFDDHNFKEEELKSVGEF